MAVDFRATAAPWGLAGHFCVEINRLTTATCSSPFGAVDIQDRPVQFAVEPPRSRRLMSKIRGRCNPIDTGATLS